MERPSIKVVSKWPVENFQIEWIVQNFNFINCKKGDSVKSPPFQFDLDGERTKWEIELFPNGEDIENEVIVYLGLLESNLRNLMVACEIVLSLTQGKQIVKDNFSPYPYSEGDSFGFLNFVNRDYLMSKVSNISTLTFTFNLEVSYKVENGYSSISNLHSSIIEDIGKLRLDTDFSDVLIKVCGKEFHAHKNILAARSPVLSSMFKTNMKESNSGKIVIEDITPEVFEEFLKFIYTGKANIKDHASELFAAADKYDVQDLKAFCENALIEDINKENCLEILILSDLHSSKKLKEEVLNFIVSNKIKTDKNELAKIKNPSLMLELVETFMNN